jgi:hypothetical protein
MCIHMRAHGRPGIAPHTTLRHSYVCRVEPLLITSSTVSTIRYSIDGCAHAYGRAARVRALDDGATKQNGSCSQCYAVYTKPRAHTHAHTHTCTHAHTHTRTHAHTHTRQAFASQKRRGRCAQPIKETNHSQLKSKAKPVPPSLSSLSNAMVSALPVAWNSVVPRSVSSLETSASSVLPGVMAPAQPRGADGGKPPSDPMRVQRKQWVDRGPQCGRH